MYMARCSKKSAELNFLLMMGNVDMNGEEVLQLHKEVHIDVAHHQWKQVRPGDFFRAWSRILSNKQSQKEN